MSEKKVSTRTETAGLFKFGKEMISALAMALIAIIYVIQAFRIPTGSMEKSLMVGDFLLGLKFIYGAPLIPFSQDLGLTARLPAITKPKPGDVIIFKYPGKDRKDYIKRCVAGPGQTIEIHGTDVIIDGRKLTLPPKGQYILNGELPLPIVRDFSPLRIPKKGDVINLDTLPIREFVFAKNLIHQENSRADLRADYQMYINGTFSRNFRWDDVDEWVSVQMRLEYLKEQVKQQMNVSDSAISFQKILYMNNQKVTSYTVKYDNYFMMGDNRDNSTDSRFWGYLNHNFVMAKAFILYFSLDKEVPMFLLPLKIRWNRIGKLIQPFDGQKQ